MSTSEFIVTDADWFVVGWKISRILPSWVLIEYEIDAKYAKGNNVDSNNEDLNGDDYGPSTVEMYTHAVILNTDRNAQTELNMEGFVMSIISKVSSNQKQAN